MSELEFVALVLAAIGPLLALAKLTGVPQLFLLAGAGLGSALLPGLPPVRVDPQFLLSSHGAFSRQEDIIGSSEDPRFECPNGVQG